LLKRAILVTYPEDFTKREALGLAEAAGYSVAKVVTQKTLRRSEYGVGSGKAQEIARIAEEEKTDTVIVDERLSSSQAHNLAKLTHQNVIDRERLILDIFYSRASTAEAKLQVQLAELKYEIPRAREAVRLSLKGEQAGFMGMGEYAVDVQFRALKKRMTMLQKKLEQARRRRELFRESRLRLELPFISLAGYTSSGKTTLFNRFVSERKEESPKLFTTLTTTTRSFEPLTGRKALLSDTVGFISRLPAYMIEAFKSTLEELEHADLILLMLDVSEPLDEINTKYESCISTLEQLHINPAKIIVVLNKLDIASAENLLETRKRIVKDLPSIGVSARTGEGMERLRSLIANRVFPDLTPVEEGGELKQPSLEQQMEIEETTRTEIVKSLDIGHPLTSKKTTTND
jgi:GTP-binding protein HflX